MQLETVKSITTPESSAIKTVIVTESPQVVGIEFKKTSGTYYYTGTPRTIMVLAKTAENGQESVGKQFNQLLRSKSLEFSALNP